MEAFVLKASQPALVFAHNVSINKRASFLRGGGNVLPRNLVRRAICNPPCENTVLGGRGNNFLRLLDRYAGIPLVAASGLLRRTRPVPAKPESVGLINTAAIGDTVLMSAIVADLREALHTSRLVALCGPSNCEVARLIPGLDAVVKLPVFSPWAAVAKVRQERLETVLDLGPWSRLNALLAVSAGAKFTAGFDTAGQFRHYGYDLAVCHSPDVHELENHRRLVRALGFATRHLPAVKLTSGDDGEWEPAQDFAVFHLWPGGTRAALKQWPLDRWIGLARAIGGSYRILLTASAAQRALNQQVIDAMPAVVRKRVMNVAGLSLAATARLLNHASLVVSVDTGIMHLAAALNAPLVGLFGPTSAKRWGPLGANAVAIESPEPGCGYLNLGFEGDLAPPCMEAITLSQVLDGCRAAVALRGASLRAPLATGHQVPSA